MRDIAGYEGLYAITSCGRVWSYKRDGTKGGWLKPQNNGYGYQKICLSKDGIREQKYIHRLVAETYLPNPDNLSEVDHVNRNKKDNNINNLRWVSYLENGRNKTKSPYKKCMNVETKEIFESQAAAAKAYGRNPATMGRAIKNGWKCAGFHWIEI